MIDFKLNFLGVTASDFKKSFQFYSEVLGIETKYSRENWAAFKTTGMKFELFSGGNLPTVDRSWGRGQAFRPSFQVADLKITVIDLREKGVRFVGDIKKASWGEYIEFIAHEEIHWILAHSPNSLFSASLRKPHIGGVELKTHNLTNQQAFYGKLMGQPHTDLGKTGIIFRKGKDELLLVLEPGGRESQTATNYYDTPLFIGFETSDIKEALKWIKTQKISVIVDIATHRWGTDFFIDDADGNLIQIAQYS